MLYKVRVEVEYILMAEDEKDIKDQLDGMLNDQILLGQGEECNFEITFLEKQSCS